MAGDYKSERRTIRETRHSDGSKLTVDHVTEGKDAAYNHVRPHFYYVKHRDGAIKQERFHTLAQAEEKLESKRGEGQPIVSYD